MGTQKSTGPVTGQGSGTARPPLVRLKTQTLHQRSRRGRGSVTFIYRN